MALAHGYALPFEALRRTGVLAQNTADATIRATADGATKEAAGSCLDARALEVQQRTVVQPSILVVPQLTRNGVVLTQLPDTRTNFIQNNTMTGATGSVAPTTWSVVAPPIGITIGYSASGQTTAADGTLVDYIDVTVSGTALASGNFNLRPEPVTSTVSGNLLFASGMTYTASFYMSLLSGSVSGVSPNYQIQEVSGTTFVSGTSLDLSAITSNLTRYSVTRPIAGTGGADRIRTRYGHSIASGQVLNYTIRIASPQLEKGSVATPVIRTVSGFVSVDMLGVARDGAPPDFTFTRATTATRVNASGLIESVASGVLRLDYPIGGGCPAGLIEPAGTNGILNSTDIATSWSLGANLSSGYVDVIGVSGNNLTVAVSGSNIGSTAGRLQRSGNNVALASGSTYTISFLMKKTGTHTIGGYYAVIAGAASGDLGGGFSVSGSFSSGSTYNSAGTTNRIRRVEQWGTDVYRCSETFTMTASGTLTAFNLAPLSGVSSASNPAVGLGIAFAAPQIELGSVPTSFIPTTAASATRNADVCSVSGVSGYIGQTEGTIYAEVLDVDILDNPIFSIDDGTNNNRIVIYRVPTTGLWNIFSASNGANTLGSGTVSSNNGKLALAYSSSGMVLYRNGVQVATSSGALPLSFSAIRLNGRVTNDLYSTKRLRAAAIYTTRLSNDQLANLTRLT
jgi:hypothetical protein